MKTVPEIIEAFGGPQRTAQLIGDVPATLLPKGMRVTATLIYQWKHRSCIPAHWYPAVLKAAKAEGIAVTSDDLIYHCVQTAAA